MSRMLASPAAQAPSPSQRRPGGSGASRGCGGGTSPAAGEAHPRRQRRPRPAGRQRGLPTGLPPPARRVPGGAGARGAGPASPLPPPGSASTAAALSPGAPLGCQKGAATCSGAESLLAARREGEQPPRRPRPGSYRCSCRRGKAAAASSWPRRRRSRRRAPVREGRAPAGAPPRSAAASRSRRGQAG